MPSATTADNATRSPPAWQWQTPEQWGDHTVKLRSGTWVGPTARVSPKVPMVARVMHRGLNQRNDHQGHQRMRARVGSAVCETKTTNNRDHKQSRGGRIHCGKTLSSCQNFSWKCWPVMSGNQNFLTALPNDDTNARREAGNDRDWNKFGDNTQPCHAEYNQNHPPSAWRFAGRLPHAGPQCLTR